MLRAEAVDQHQFDGAGIAPPASTALRKSDWDLLKCECTLAQSTEQDLLFANRVGRLDLLEVCCAEDSTLGAAFIAKDGKIARLGL